jgi:hypothetical protein
MSDPAAATVLLRLTIAGYDAQAMRNPDGGLTVTINVGFGWHAVAITGDEWRALVAFQPGAKP